MTETTGKLFHIRKRQGLLICLLIVAIVSEGCSMSIFNGWNPFRKDSVVTENLAIYVQDLTGLQVEDLCEEESGEITRSSSRDSVRICLKLKKGGIEEVQKRMEELGKAPGEDNITIPGYSGHELAQKLKQEELAAYYYYFFSGSGGAKTQSVELYLSRDSEGNEYLYLFG